jgi:triphosphoribosyl-dephospho-CoA synthase
MHVVTRSSSQTQTSACHLQPVHPLAVLAKQALIAEAELTPKPGLVDRRGSGAHYDLSLDLMCRSAETIEPYFSQMAFLSANRKLDASLRAALASVGRDAERAMYNSTGGSNAHKGAIWILGLLVAAAARKRQPQSAREIAEVAGSIARLPDHAQPVLVTHGDIVRCRYGAAGARGEATNNFPHVLGFGLPMLRKRRASGCSEEISRLDALLNIMSSLDDTCVLYRGGADALAMVKSGAKVVLLAGGCGHPNGKKKLQKLDRALMASHISPGGSADLLAATIFLDALETRQIDVLENLGQQEASNGAA